MKILKEGTKVTTVIGNIEAMITGVTIESETVTYRLRYFTGGLIQECWLYGFEIEVTPIKQSAGFGKKIISKNNEDVILID